MTASGDVHDSNIRRSAMDIFSRRELFGVGAAGLALGTGKQDNPGAAAENEMELSVKKVGAAGNGKKDDTAAFQSAIDAVHEQGGGGVFIPPGNYLIQGHLVVKRHVALRGVWQAPTARTQNAGSCLLAVEGAGEPDGTPFITLHENGTLRGLTVFYPEQEEDPPKPYPWCVRGNGDNCSIVDVLLVNPYMAVDFGTLNSGRHYIDGLYAQALHRGVFVDKCFDVGRIEDVHLWPFWAIQGPAREYTIENGIGFVIGRTDWEYMLDCFCIGYSVGFNFVANPDHGPGNVVLTQCGSDVGPLAVKVDAVQPHSGISFANSQMMATVEIAPENHGPVKFTGCGFWPVDATAHQLRLAGDSLLSLSNCHFSGWDKAGEDVPCIIAEKGVLKLNGCDFLERDKKHISLGPGVRGAAITGNSFAGPPAIDNKTKGDVKIIGNITV